MRVSQIQVSSTIVGEIQGGLQFSCTAIAVGEVDTVVGENAIDCFDDLQRLADEAVLRHAKRWGSPRITVPERGSAVRRQVPDGSDGLGVPGRDNPR